MVTTFSMLGVRGWLPERGFVFGRRENTPKLLLPTAVLCLSVDVIIIVKAGDRGRTDNIQLGRLTLCQLSYARKNLESGGGEVPFA